MYTSMLPAVLCLTLFATSTALAQTAAPAEPASTPVATESTPEAGTSPRATPVGQPTSNSSVAPSSQPPTAAPLAPGATPTVQSPSNGGSVDATEAPSAYPALAPSTLPAQSSAPEGGAVTPTPRPPTPTKRPNESEPTESAEDETTRSVQLEAPEPSQGHFIAVGLHGIGAMAFDENRGTREPTFGQGVTLRVGESLTDWFTLSLAFGLGDTYGKPQDALTFGRFGITSQLYFSERWFLQAGFGAANIQGPDPEDHDVSRGRYGDVYLTGIGRNFYISDADQSGGWVFTPLLTAEVGPDSKFTTASLWLGIEFSYWTGLTPDKLDLPLSKAYAKSKD